MLWLLQQQYDLEALLIHIFMPPTKDNDTPYLDGLPGGYVQKKCDLSILMILKIPICLGGRGKKSPSTVASHLSMHYFLEKIGFRFRV
jgi:hypothetical protein